MFRALENYITEIIICVENYTFMCEYDLPKIHIQEMHIMKTFESNNMQRFYNVIELNIPFSESANFINCMSSNFHYNHIFNKKMFLEKLYSEDGFIPSSALKIEKNIYYKNFIITLDLFRKLVLKIKEIVSNYKDIDFLIKNFEERFPNITEMRNSYLHNDERSIPKKIEEGSQTILITPETEMHINHSTGHKEVYFDISNNYSGITINKKNKCEIECNADNLNKIIETYNDLVNIITLEERFKLSPDV